jgi:hypothetical protein
MSYELSFSEEFFFGEGEPYDASELYVNDAGEPSTVWSAIHVWKERNPKEWKNMAKEVFGVPLKESELLTIDAVYEKIRATSVCSNLSSPVEVWVDPAGDYRMQVHS